ncbi:30S ribosomal protein S2 [Patescibacteria group bacterium]|nr:30S ribosomal protein S2 [Patescibacteria group bacterium]
MEIEKTTTIQAAVQEEPKLDKDLQEMAEAGLQFGHRKSRTHPKMKPYISGVRNSIHIIDLKYTKEKLDEALAFIKELIEEDKVLLFVGTKVQVRQLVKETAQAVSLPYVSERWIGGIFTNFDTVSKRIERLNELEQGEKDGSFEKYTKQEQAKIKDEIDILNKKFGGMKNVTKLPDAIFVLDINESMLAIREAKKKGISIIALADTNTDPSIVDYAIPANDDAVSSLRYILDKVKETIQNAKGKSSAN